MEDIHTIALRVLLLIAVALILCPLMGCDNPRLPIDDHASIGASPDNDFRDGGGVRLRVEIDPSDH